MSEGMKDEPGGYGAVPVNPTPETPGALLRAARERAGLHVAALAVAIKIPVKKLEALESDQLHLTHDIVFTRALASSVCRALKIDAKPVLDALPQSTVRELHVDDNGINAPFAASSGVATPSLVDALRQPWVMLVLALGAGVIAILGLGWWEDQESSTVQVAQAVSEVPVVVPQVAAPIVIPPAATDTPNPAALSATSSPVPVVAELPKESGAVVATMPVPDSALPKVTVPAPDKPPNPFQGSELVMSFRAKHQPVWVEVIDSRGEVRLRRNLAAGEKVECGGALPLSVVLGRADSVDVEVRGKPFNFSQFARENVAKFEVK